MSAQRASFNVRPGRAPSRTSYNGRGLVTAQTRHATAIAGAPVGTLPPANAADRRSTQTFDAAGRVLECADALGVVTCNAYDAIGNVTQVLENASAQFGSTARTTRYEYDLANQRKTQTDASGLVTRFEYDALYAARRPRGEHALQAGGRAAGRSGHRQEPQPPARLGATTRTRSRSSRR